MGIPAGQQLSVIFNSWTDLTAGFICLSEEGRGACGGVWGCGGLLLHVCSLKKKKKKLRLYAPNVTHFLEAAGDMLSAAVFHGLANSVNY